MHYQPAAFTFLSFLFTLRNCIGGNLTLPFTSSIVIREIRTSRDRWVEIRFGALCGPCKMIQSLVSKKCMKKKITRASFTLLVIFLIFLNLYSPCPVSAHPSVKYVILLIGDGLGANHIQATNSFTHTIPIYQNWDSFWMTTYPKGSSYDPAQAWSNFDYIKNGATDSAAAASAMYTGEKTSNGSLSVTADGEARLFTIAEKAHSLNWAAGAVSSVYISHATPGAWFSHNLSRSNGFAIADEALWGDPNTTGTASTDPLYAGSFGPTIPAADVLIGAGHPYWSGDDYVNQQMRDRLVIDSSRSDNFAFVERVSGSPNGGQRLLEAASDPAITRLVGLFGGAGGNLEYRMADGNGLTPENPTLAQMTQAALEVLQRNSNGFVLMVEGGAIDWGSHLNDMNKTIGEVIAFNEAVQAVVDWVVDPDNGSSWDNTLVIVTADHDCGYLSAAPDSFSNVPLGAVNMHSLSLEKTMAGSNLRASWEDADLDRVIDAGEQVYWAWNSSGHTNSLVPIFVKGNGAELFNLYATGSDPIRGDYLDNTNIFDVINAAITTNQPTPTPGGSPNTSEVRLFIPLVIIAQQ